jgi:hypothetical protein
VTVVVNNNVYSEGAHAPSFFIDCALALAVSKHITNRAENNSFDSALLADDAKKVYSPQETGKITEILF